MKDVSGQWSAVSGQRRSTSSGRLRRWGALCAFLAGAVLLYVAIPASGQNEDASEAAEEPAAGTDQPVLPGADENDAQRLLGEREREQGPTFPGKDPAFLVLPRPLDRGNMADDLLTDDVRKITDEMLEYLARTQDPDGGWSDTQFPSNTGVTALCCMAFLSEGSRPRAGKYGRQLDRGLEFLLKNVQTNGAIAGKGSNPLGPGYEHAMSTLALLMCYGDMPWRPQTRDVLSRAVQLTLRSQRLDGGWRYQLNREGLSDMSVTANVLWVLRTAKKSGFTVDAKAIEEGVEFVEKCALPDGTFRYRQFGIHASPSLGGTGIVALSNNGNLDHILIAPARDRIEYEYRRYTINDLKERRYFVFGAFYASLAMYSCGDEYWMPWFEKATAVMGDMQRKDGELWDEYDNHIYPTAMGAMILQAPRGYLPIYER